MQLIVKGKDLKVLSICENQNKEDTERLTNIDGVPRKFVPDLPTWVPNWAQERTSEELWGGYITDWVADPFEAAGWKSPEVDFHGISLIDSKGLRTIRAKTIATVNRVGQDIHGGSVGDVVQDAFRLGANAPVIVPAGENGADGVLRSFKLDRDAEGQKTYDEIANEPPEIRRSMHRACIGRRFFRIKEGFVGLGPRRLKAHDRVMLVPGCHVPIMLRAGVFVKNRTKIKCNSHLEVEVCLGLGCSKDKDNVALRYEVIGETCKYLSLFKVAWRLKQHRSAWSDER